MESKILQIIECEEPGFIFYKIVYEKIGFYAVYFSNYRQENRITHKPTYKKAYRLAKLLSDARLSGYNAAKEIYKD